MFKKKVESSSQIRKLGFLETIKVEIKEEKVSNAQLNRFGKRIANTIKMFIVSSKKFMNDDCLTRSSAIAYTVIVSLIPVLTVCLTFFTIANGATSKKDLIIHNVQIFLIEHNLSTFNIEPYLNIVLNLIDNAQKIGIVGMVILIFSATAILRNMEVSLNHIMHVKKPRSWVNKIIYYWGTLTLGPLLILAASTVGTTLTKGIAQPDYFQNKSYNNYQWTCGSKGTISYFDFNENKVIKLTDSNFNFKTNSVYTYNATKNTLEKDAKIYDSLARSRFTFKDIAFIENQGWCVGSNGIILHSLDSGKNWTFAKWGSFNFIDIQMFDKESGIVISDNGAILATENKGKTWKVVNKSFLGKYHFNSLNFDNNLALITADSGVILRSYNKGKTWSPLKVPETKLKKSYQNISNSYIFSPAEFWLVTDNGLLLKTTNYAKKFKAYHENSTKLNDILFANKLTGFAVGAKGTILYTTDGGKFWDKTEIQANQIYDIRLDDKELFVTGENGLFLKTTTDKIKWTGDVGSNKFINFINYFFPFLIIWILILLIYQALPNSKLPFKPCAIGAGFTSLIWILFVLFFNIYIRYFAKSTFAIYGALAGIPLFFLMIYLSAVILLFGAEISYTLMHPSSYYNMRKTLKDITDYHFFLAIAIIYNIYKNFNKNTGGTKYDDLLKLAAYQDEELKYYLNKFIDHNYIIKIERDSYIPATTGNNINLWDVLKSVDFIDKKIPSFINTTDGLKSYVKKYLIDIEDSEKLVLQEISLAKMITDLEKENGNTKKKRVKRTKKKNILDEKSDSNKIIKSDERK